MNREEIVYGLLCQSSGSQLIKLLIDQIIPQGYIYIKKNMCSVQQLSPGIYLATYLFMFFLYGLEGGSVGPIIPYLAKQRNVQQTSYSFLFIARSVGSIVAFLIFKYFQWKQFKYVQHRIMVVWTLIVCGVMIMFVEWDSRVAEFASLAIYGGGHYGALTVANICVIAITQKKASIWVILINALYGVGALIAPQIIRFIDLECYFIYAGLFLVLCGLYLIFPTPMTKYGSNDVQSTIKINQQTADAEANDQAVNQQSLTNPILEKQAEQPQFKKASRKLQLLIALGLFLIAGIENTVPGWLPTYVVLTKIVDKSQATIYTTLFWSVSTLFRFAAAAITANSKIKLKILITSICLISSLCCILHACQQYNAAAMVGSIGYGMACSAVFPLIVSISIQFGIKFSSEQLSNMMIAPILSSMCITAVDGELMGWSIDMLFYFLLFISVMLAADAFLFFRVMSSEKMNQNKLPEESGTRESIISNEDETKIS